MLMAQPTAAIGTPDGPSARTSGATTPRASESPPEPPSIERERAFGPAHGDGRAGEPSTDQAGDDRFDRTDTRGA